MAGGGGCDSPQERSQSFTQKVVYGCLTDIDKRVMKNPKHLKKYVFGLDHLFQVECRFREEIK